MEYLQEESKREHSETVDVKLVYLRNRRKDLVKLKMYLGIGDFEMIRVLSQRMIESGEMYSFPEIKNLGIEIKDHSINQDVLKLRNDFIFFDELLEKLENYLKNNGS